MNVPGIPKGDRSGPGLAPTRQYRGVTREELNAGDDHEIGIHRHKAVNPIVPHRRQMVGVSGEKVKISHERQSHKGRRGYRAYQLDSGMIPICSVTLSKSSMCRSITSGLALYTSQNLAG